MNRRSLLKLLGGVAATRLSPLEKFLPNGPEILWIPGDFISYNVRYSIGLPPSGWLKVRRISADT